VSRLKRWIKTTPLYPTLKAIRDATRTKSRVDRIERRDTEQMAKILPRLLPVGGNAIDIGAHRGDILEQFLRGSPTGQHIAVEAIPELAEHLRITFPTVEVHSAAAGDRPGTTEFQWVVSNPAFSGLKRRDDLGAGESVRPLSVRVVRIDDLVPKGRPVAVIKIDVEGAELGVLRGAQRVLNENRPWIFFEHGSAATQYGTTTADIAAEFARHALAVWLMGDWLAGRPPLSTEAFAAAAATGDFWNFLAGPHRLPPRASVPS